MPIVSGHEILMANNMKLTCHIFIGQYLIIEYNVKTTTAITTRRKLIHNGISMIMCCFVIENEMMVTLIHL